MTFRQSILACCSVLFLAACGSDDDPSSTVGMAAHALKKDDTQTFLGLLIGPAKAKYQNAAAREELQDYLNQYRKPSVT